jgi:hypothetical protein
MHNRYNSEYSYVILDNFTQVGIIQSDQEENKSRVLPHFLFYRNVCLSLTVHRCIPAIHSCFIGCLALEKFIIN